MTVILLLIVASILLAGGFLAAFLWAVRSGQFDDRHTPSMRILFDDKIDKVKTHDPTQETTAPELNKSDSKH